MADLVFMAIEGIEGEEPIGSDQKLIRIFGYQHGLSTPIAPARPSVGEHARFRRSYCEHGAFTVYKQLDKTSGEIFKLCANGTMVEHVAIYLCASLPGDNPLKKAAFEPGPIFTVLLKNVIVAGFNYELKPLADSHVERVEFRYMTISWKLNWKDPEDGIDQNLSAVGWDGELNESAGIDTIPDAVKFGDAGLI